MEQRSQFGEYVQSEDYLKRNAAGAHSNSHVIIESLEELRNELHQQSQEISVLKERIDRFGVAVLFAFAIVGWLAWSSS